MMVNQCLFWVHCSFNVLGNEEWRHTHKSRVDAEHTITASCTVHPRHRFSGNAPGQVSLFGIAHWRSSVTGAGL